MKSKFAYFGTPYVARDTLTYLLTHGYQPEVVVTSPDAPRGRGHVMTQCETKTLAIKEGLPVLTPETVNSTFIKKIKEFDCEYAIVVAYGKILPEELLHSFPLGVINVHYSLLPKYRGASPVESALLHGDEVTGVAVQRMAKELDAGDILAIKEVEIRPNETTKEIRPRLIQTGAELLVEILPKFEARELIPTPQNATQATRARKIKKEQGELDLAADARENWNKYRAYAEWPGTYFFRDGKRIKITKASFVDGRFVIERVTPEGKREMEYRALDPQLPKRK